MASLHRDPRTGNWIISFRWGGRQHNRSCKTDSRIEARELEASVEGTIRLLDQGRLEIPENADPATWIMSGGKLNKRPQLGKDRFGDVCDAYFECQNDKADTTLDGESVHIRHLKRVLGERTKLDRIDLDRLQRYVSKRLKEKFRKKTITGKTVRKELVTFTQIWTWARSRNLTDRTCPIYNGSRRWAVNVPKPVENEKFMTWDEIEERNDPELWKFVFLDEDQVGELLKHVDDNATYDFIHPMFVFAAYTGARRSEILRSKTKDFNFDLGQVRIRERKRRKDMAMTYRTVPMHAKLRRTIQSWFKQHPGGEYTITLTGTKMSKDSARHHFKKTLKDSEWEVLRGFHVLRHSFGANLARSGEVDRDTIGAWMGHSTEEMKQHYQHLFPQDDIAKISVLA